jgi:hypothetical protein
MYEMILYILKRLTFVAICDNKRKAKGYDNNIDSFSKTYPYFLKF